MEPNLFSFATSELSNDALICWLFAWGNNPESPFYPLANDLVGLTTGGKITEPVHTISIHRQFKHIDILLTINDQYVVAIENKVNSREHSDQLERYKTEVKNAFSHIQPTNQFFCYWKIIDDSDFLLIEKKGYTVVRRRDLLNVFNNYIHLTNDIFKDYHRYINQIEAETNSYHQLPFIQSWPTRAWQGFYTMLQQKVNPEKACWQYVSNPRGGFWAFWWGVREYNFKYIPYYLYLQHEQGRITIKVEVHDSSYQSIIRDMVWGCLKDILLKMEVEKLIVRKTNFSKGRWMTIAEITGMLTMHDLEKGMRIGEEILIRLDAKLAFAPV